MRPLVVQGHPTSSTLVPIESAWHMQLSRLLVMNSNIGRMQANDQQAMAHMKMV